MYKEIPRVHAPCDNTRIWRYMHLEKYAAMLQQQSLYFCRVSQLEDPYEGKLPEANVNPDSPLFDNVPQRFGPAIVDTFKKTYEKLRYCFFVNCWHMNEHESSAMWKLYADQDRGIAVQSSIGMLRASFAGYTDSIYIGVVNYLDYSEDALIERGIDVPFLAKRNSFSYEAEVRAFRRDFSKLYSPNIEQDTPVGIAVPVNIADLVHRVYVAPKAPNWYKMVVQSITDKYGFREIEICRSEISQGPLY